MLRRALRSESIRSDGIIESSASAGVTIAIAGSSSGGAGVVKANALSKGGGGSTVVAAVNRNDEEVSCCHS